VTLQLKRTPTFCAQLSEIRASHRFRPSPAHKPRSPKSHHVAAMLFQTGSSPWDADAHGAVSVCSERLLFVPVGIISLFLGERLLPSSTPQPGGQCPGSGLGNCLKPGQSRGPTGLNDGCRDEKVSYLSSKCQSQNPHEIP